MPFQPQRDRRPPSPSTYALFVASAHPSRFPPGNTPFLDHRQHIHYGPAEGIYDCPKQNDKIEDRYGYCFRVKESDFWRDKALVKWGGNHWGQEEGRVSWGDAAGVVALISMVIVLWTFLKGARWVWRLGKRLRNEKKKPGFEHLSEKDIDSPYLTEYKLTDKGKEIGRPPLMVGRGRQAVLQAEREREKARNRRGGFSDSDLLKMEDRDAVRRDSRYMGREQGVGSEVYRNGEWVYTENEVGVESYYGPESGAALSAAGRWRDVDLRERRGDTWMPGVQGDLLHLQH